MTTTAPPVSSFARLTKKGWKTDAGFIAAIAADPGTLTYKVHIKSPGRRDAVAYWRREKGDYVLWQLLRYMGEHQVPQTLAYFGLPADTRQFLNWLYNHVEHAERQGVAQMRDVSPLACRYIQMHFFPFPDLYQLWQVETDAERAERAEQRGNVRVYLDRITEPDGTLMMTLKEK